MKSALAVLVIAAAAQASAQTSLDPYDWGQRSVKGTYQSPLATSKDAYDWGQSETQSQYGGSEAAAKYRMHSAVTKTPTHKSKDEVTSTEATDAGVGTSLSNLVIQQHRLNGIGMPKDSSKP
ncbi:hypothetical protein HHL11_22630 [Ramlibacter sp. G-1-2-2]|uniref:DUF4148 domain-containing protein n=1 Tax=Ramlibacter agri TaxID=2728837 RepID=A0A848HAM6_9BURK|nr:hypothetical protein [Ramlibacter agri]NML46559.1 hypothetical protein [Ramlibacter agri]